MPLELGRRQITLAIILIVAGAIGIAVYLQNALTSVARNLPLTLIDQERDAETVIREIANLAWVIELWRREEGSSSAKRVELQIRIARMQVDTLRANYNLDNMIGAAGMHAVANPALQDRSEERRVGKERRARRSAEEAQGQATRWTASARRVDA